MNVQRKGILVWTAPALAAAVLLLSGACGGARHGAAPQATPTAEPDPDAARLRLQRRLTLEDEGDAAPTPAPAAPSEPAPVAAPQP